MTAGHARTGNELPTPRTMSSTSTVPVAVPSVVHSSRPFAPCAANTVRLPTFWR